jgi:N-acetylglucosamine-6-phosphate deacetylase
MTDHNFEIVKRNADIIRRITIAPEIEANFRRIPALVDMGMVVAGGHSDATYDETLRAHKAGMAMITHLYSAMSTIRRENAYRISGMLEAAMNTGSLYTEMIADRKHLPDELMQIAFRCKGPDKLMLCSDANRGAGCKEGGRIFTCGQEAVIKDGVAFVPDMSAFASSITPIDQMVRNVINHAGISKADAVKMVTATPARMLGVFDRKGSIEKGKDADIILLDRDFYVKWVMCRGKIRYTEPFL